MLAEMEASPPARDAQDDAADQPTGELGLYALYKKAMYTG